MVSERWYWAHQAVIWPWTTYLSPSTWVLARCTASAAPGLLVPTTCPCAMMGRESETSVSCSPVKAQRPDSDNSEGEDRRHRLGTAGTHPPTLLVLLSPTAAEIFDHADPGPLAGPYCPTAARSAASSFAVHGRRPERSVSAPGEGRSTPGESVSVLTPPEVMTRRGWLLVSRQFGLRRVSGRSGRWRTTM